MCLRTAAGRSEPHRPQGDIFTFDTESLRVMSRCQPSRSSKRPRRVLYPAIVRRYLPPQRRDHTKTWLLLLCTVIALQVYSEQPAPLAEQEELSSPGLPQCSLEAGLGLGLGLGFNSSHMVQAEPEQTPKTMTCAYLELFVEVTSLRL
ncbi:radiation-inducible immediate-early gene IEX-1-like [Heterodontus francisci]|uniref:radiation-inducible immediate-early gene IEX-1-like n=1 Tax=Heterodontus francisci TaxID=7792 RepID=UPI00355B9E4E